MLGAQSVNPDIKVKIIWVNSWFDPGKEADAAKVLLDQGADIIVQHTDSTGAAADRRRAGQAWLRPGVRHDQVRARRPSSPRSSTTGRRYYIERVKAVLDGTWTSTDTWGGLDRRHGRHGALHQHARRREEDGGGDGGERSRPASCNPFTGPITKQDGTVVGEGGKPLPDGEILGMNWYVKGIDDKLPQ